MLRQRAFTGRTQMHLMAIGFLHKCVAHIVRRWYVIIWRHCNSARHMLVLQLIVYQTKNM